MGSTNKTAHYELPQFMANDKPSWLGDVNEAMEAIDTGIYGAKSSADGAQQTANNAVAGVQSAGTRMDGIQTQLDTVATQANQTATTVAGHTSSIATNSANINTLNSRMGSTDISGIGDGTVTGAIDAISQGSGSTVVAEVTADGVKTQAQMLNALYSAISGNVNLNARLEFEIVDGNKYVAHISKASAAELEFDMIQGGSSDFTINAYIVNASTSKLYHSTRANTVDQSAQVTTAGNKYRIVQ